MSDVDDKVGRRALIARALIAVAVVAAVVGLALSLQSDNGDGRPLPSTGSSPPEPPAAFQEVELDAIYEACARASGFDPGGVQVLIEETGRPWWVKTGRDVPAEIHRPCLMRIGGADPRSSSHGPP